MENQSNLGSEQMNEEETLTFTVGQSQLPGTPHLNRVYMDEDGNFSVYLIDVGDGTLQIHSSIKGKVTISRMKHFEQVFLGIVLGLMERGLDHIDTWVFEDPKQIRYSEFFGFEMTGFKKILSPIGLSQPVTMLEMRYMFPALDKE
jgi:hypothetical protein